MTQHSIFNLIGPLLAIGGWVWFMVWTQHRSDERQEESDRDLRRSHHR